MVDISSLGDAEKQAAGVWLDYTFDTGGKVRLLIASASNRNFKEKYQRLYAEQVRLKNSASLDADTLLDIDTRAAIGTILCGWEGFTSGGEDYPFSEENAYRLVSLNTLEMESFRKFVQIKSAQARTFAEEVRAADEAALKSVS